MNAYAPAPRHITHDGVPGHRLATLGVPNHHPVDALDADPLRRPANSVYQPIEWARLSGLGIWLGVGIQLLQHLRDVDVALTDGCDEVVQIGGVERLPNSQQVRFLRLGQPPPLDLAIKNLPAELDRCVVLFYAESLPDL